MKQTIKTELTEHINDYNKEDRNHFTMFNMTFISSVIIMRSSAQKT